MSVNEAKQFALAAVYSKQKALPGFALEPPQNLADGLYLFQAVWQGIPFGSVGVGFYAVDPVTGAVWDAAAECQQRTTRQLRTLQYKHRQELGLKTIQLERFQAKGPQCS